VEMARPSASTSLSTAVKIGRSSLQPPYRQVLQLALACLFGNQISVPSVTFGRFFLEPGSMSRAQLALIKRTALIHGIAANDRGADAAAADRARRRVAACEQVDLLSHCEPT